MEALQDLLRAEDFIIAGDSGILRKDEVDTLSRNAAAQNEPLESIGLRVNERMVGRCCWTVGAALTDLFEQRLAGESSDCIKSRLVIIYLLYRVPEIDGSDISGKRAWHMFLPFLIRIADALDPYKKVTECERHLARQLLSNPAEISMKTPDEIFEMAVSEITEAPHEAMRIFYSKQAARFPTTDDQKKKDIALDETITRLLNCRVLSMPENRIILESLSRMQAESTLLVRFENLPRAAFIKLIEENVKIAPDIIYKLVERRNEQVHYYISIMMQMDLSVLSVESVLKLYTGNLVLAREPLRAFVSHCLSSCDEVSNTPGKQNRQVRMVCLFVCTLLKKEILPVKQLYTELNEFILRLMGGSDDSIFISFVRALPAPEREHLIGQTSSAFFLFRVLSQSAQAALVSLLYNNHSEIADVDALKVLQSLDLVQSANGDVVISESFRRAYLSACALGAHRCARLLFHEGGEKKKKDKELTTKSNERWQSVLRYLALPSDSTKANVSQTTRDVFVSAGLTSSDGAEITSSGFQFLLLTPVKQVWSYVIELLKMEMRQGRSVRELLDLLLRLALSVDSADPERRPFKIDPAWTERQMNFVTHLRELGLIFMRKRKDGFFYLTSLMGYLAAGEEGEENTRKGGSIVVETNFRIYAYTSSTLQLAILSLFTQMTYRFHDMSVGVLSRDSVRAALQVGITADQITSFLRANAHPRAANTPHPVPITVADQIRLWEEERARLLFQDAALYSGFENETEFSEVADYARQRGHLLFAERRSKCVVVTSAGHDEVKAWWRRRGQAT